MAKDLVWFDVRRYGYNEPLSVDPMTLEGILAQAEEMVEKAKGEHDPKIFMDLWMRVLKASSFTPTVQWRLLVLLHMAMMGLMGYEEPTPIFYDDDLDK